MYCELFRKTCIKEECGAFVCTVPITNPLEKANALGVSFRSGMYCLRFKKELCPVYEYNDKKEIVRKF